jgi:hypothetical protein
MTRALRIAILAVIVPLLAVPARADEAPRAEFRVTRFDPGDRPPPQFLAGSERLEMAIPLTHIGGPYTASLRDGRFLDFWRGQDARPEISLAIAENERKDLLLVFIPADTGFRILKVRTPLNGIRGTDRYLVNATETQLAVKIGGDKPVLIESGQSGLLPGPRGSEVVSLPVLISRRQGDAWKLASTENWHFDPRFRSFLFAYISPRNRHLAFHVVTERL